MRLTDPLTQSQLELLTADAVATVFDPSYKAVVSFDFEGWV